ncbi:hypothetical protein BCR43DRAFT_559733 [Syncephalastrum racemosum]|uniref:Uncharacterized protein n=1 Tax=Syncephalastrum racemosum TaxID=13706 RepID=A0A1X2HTT1_SYNRA|nr:hypothetical protein BCR43DRAFT_559733 [Syncephalastrum racemosum]
MLSSEKHTKELPTLPVDNRYQEEQEQEQRRKTEKRHMAAVLVLMFVAFTILCQLGVKPFVWRAGSQEKPPFTLPGASKEMTEFMTDLWHSFGEPENEGYCHTNPEPSAIEEKLQAVKNYIAFPPKGLEHGRPPPRCRHEPCKPHDLPYHRTLTAEFDPHSNAHADIRITGVFTPRSGHVIVNHDGEGDKVKVHATIFAQNESALQDVSLHAGQCEDRYVVDLRRHWTRRCPKDSCLTFVTVVSFPKSLQQYRRLDLHVRHARRIASQGLDTMAFDSFRAGVGHGAIILSDVKANHTLLGALYGVVMGDYRPMATWGGMAVRGATDVHLRPVHHANMTATTWIGPAAIHLPADEFQGDFKVWSTTTEPTIVAPNPEDIHIVKEGFLETRGYYKREHTGAQANVLSHHGSTRLLFQ